jgi:hypothetical protein
VEPELVEGETGLRQALPSKRIMVNGYWQTVIGDHTLIIKKEECEID